MDNEQTMIEDYLDSKTFRCDRYNAQMSERQCMINCARTMYNVNVYDRRRKAQDADITRFGNLRFLFYTQLFLGKMTCKGCSRFIDPDSRTQKMVDDIQKRRSFEPLCGGCSEDIISASSSL